jgi:Uma2 family endonuclease
MTRVLSNPTSRLSIPSLDDVQHFIIEDATWDLYETLLRSVDNRAVRITYDDGRLEMMSSLTWHEEVKKIIARMVETLTLELDIKVKSLGSATFRRKDKAKGLEPDECYYFKHEAKMRGKRRWVPSKDPAPELVIEIDITARSIDRQPVYAALGVRESGATTAERSNVSNSPLAHITPARPAASSPSSPSPISLASSNGFPKMRTRSSETSANGSATMAGRSRNRKSEAGNLTSGRHFHISIANRRNRLPGDAGRAG